MNYYEHHLGDWAAATSHLTWDEDMAYTRLLRAYYHAERPIPQGQQYRLAKASTPAQRRAVDTVLGEFFVLVEGVYRQKRADAEIARYQDKQAKARSSANARWNGRESQSGRNANASPDAMRTHSEGNALQTPDTSNTPSSPQGDKNAGRPEDPKAEDHRPTIPCPYAEIVQAYHEALPDLPRAKLMPTARQRAMRKLWGWVLSSSKADGTPRARDAGEALGWFRAYFARAAENDFLMGRTPRSAEHAGWQCDLDFLLTDRGLKQVIERTREAA